MSRSRTIPLPEVLLPSLVLSLFAGCTASRAPSPVIPVKAPAPAEREIASSKAEWHDASEFLSIAARYEVRQSQISRRPRSHTFQFDFWRTGDRIEIHNLATHSGEIWIRAADGDIVYQRVFHDDKRVIEYTSGDLRALNRYPSWEAKAGLIEPSVLQRLQHTGSSAYLGRPAEHYQGQIDGIDVELLWFADLKLPAQIRYVSEGHEHSLNLLEYYRASQAPWERPSIRDYQSIDYADLGDNEADPFIQKVLESGEGHHHR